MNEGSRTGAASALVVALGAGLGCGSSHHRDAACDARAAAAADALRAYAAARSPLLEAERRTLGHRAPRLVVTERPPSTSLSGDVIAISPDRIEIADGEQEISYDPDWRKFAQRFYLPTNELRSSDPPMLWIAAATPWWAVGGALLDLERTGYRRVQLMFLSPDGLDVLREAELRRGESIEDFAKRVGAEADRACPAIKSAWLEGPSPIEDVAALLPTCDCDADLDLFVAAMSRFMGRADPVAAIPIDLDRTAPYLPIPDDRAWSEASVDVLAAAARGPIWVAPPPPPKGISPKRLGPPP